MRLIINRHKLYNAMETVLLIGGMSLLLAIIAELFFGGDILPWVFFLSAVSLIITVKISPNVVLKMYRARPLLPKEAPELYQMLEELARRAGLPGPPRLYHVPSPVMNAFTVGSRYNAAIALTDGLLRNLTMRELAGVLGHEIGHLVNNDLQVMAVADTVGRLTESLCFAGQVLIVLNLPILAGGGATIPWSGIVLLLFAPTVSSLLQLAVSRVREFDADLEAARLTADPEGLISALEKMEEYQQNLLRKLFMPGWNNPAPSILRTHPPTDERIRRLREVEREILHGGSGRHYAPLFDPESGRRMARLEGIDAAYRLPRKRMLGYWY